MATRTAHTQNTDWANTRELEVREKASTANTASARWRTVWTQLIRNMPNVRPASGHRIRPPPGASVNGLMAHPRPTPTKNRTMNRA